MIWNVWLPELPWVQTNILRKSNERENKAPCHSIESQPSGLPLPHSLYSPHRLSKGRTPYHRAQWKQVFVTTLVSVALLPSWVGNQLLIQWRGLSPLTHRRVCVDQCNSEPWVNYQHPAPQVLLSCLTLSPASTYAPFHPGSFVYLSVCLCCHASD